MNALQCAYCGTAFPTGASLPPTEMNCQGCGAPFAPGTTMPPMVAPGTYRGGSLQQASRGGSAGGILAYVFLFVIAICSLGLFLMLNHHQPGAPFFGIRETRTSTGWKFTKPDGTIFEINNPKLSASEAQDMANALEHQSTGAGNH